MPPCEVALWWHTLRHARPWARWVCDLREGPRADGALPVPTFYHRPQTIMDPIHQSIGKALDQVGVEHDLFQRWSGHGSGGEPARRHAL